jgi:Flavodoxin domain
MTAGRSGPGPDAFRPRADTADVVGVSNVLVVYASAHGSTKGVAERIAARLGERGARVEVRPVDEVDDIGAYDSVILGSAVYSQSWIPNANEFLRRNADCSEIEEIDPAYSAGDTNGGTTGAVTAATGARTTATTGGTTGGTTAATAAADPDCCGDSSMRARGSRPTAPSPLSRAMRVHGPVTP